MLTALASPADLTARNIVAPSGMNLAAVLDAVSAAIRDAAGCPISQLTSTVTLIALDLDRVDLPAGPVTDVSAVSVDGVPVIGWAKLGDAVVMPSGWTRTLPVEVTVSYTHGLAQVPADIVDMACGMTAMALARSGDYGSSERLASYRLGDYAETYMQPSGGVDASPFAIPDDVRQRLRARFGNSAGVLRSS